MKYVLISIAALTLYTGTASAQDKNWPCIDLKANWQNAPEKQCRQTFIEGEQTAYQNRFREVEVVEVETVEDR
jgi:hypothetical protein